MNNSFISRNARIDLHTHSLRSDGTYTPMENMQRAKDAGLDIVALTDHDTTSGWAEARGACEALGLGFIPGIEITTREPNPGGKAISIHLLAYLPDPYNRELLQVLDNSIESRTERVLKIVDLLAEDYPELTRDHLLAKREGEKVLGRPAIADSMVELGLIEDRLEFFSMVYPGSKYYVPNTGVPTTTDAIRLVIGAGGVPIIAHPMARSGKKKQGEEPPFFFPREHFVNLVEAGLAGFEVDHREVGAEAREALTAFISEFDLIRTGSSDYHGYGKPNLLGENTTAPDQLERILAISNNASLALLNYGN
jgi:predicted metal-dependent phosphoesterase TrpH